MNRRRIFLVEIDESSQSIAVIGLGGDGTSVVSALRAAHPNSAQYLTLDAESDLFSYFFAGYSRDVFPVVQTWAKGEGVSIANWFDVNGWYSPLNELPDIFLRNTERPVMRASLLMWRAKVAQYIESSFTAPDVIVLTTCAGGSTGSAWIADVARIAKEVFPQASIRIVLHDGLKSERYLDNYVVQKMLINSFWTFRELGADEHLSRCTSVVGSTMSATELIAGVINSDDGFVSKAEGAELTTQVADFARQIYTEIDNFWNRDRFISGRCYPLSEILSDNEWNAQAGLLLAIAEERVTRPSGSDSQAWDEIEFRASDGSMTGSVVAPRIQTIGGQFFALALSHNGLGTTKHSSMYQLLADEGSMALNGTSPPISAEAREHLLRSQVQISDRLSQSVENRSGMSRLNYIDDFYPKLSGLIDRLLQK
jgi:hypothetical protein